MKSTGLQPRLLYLARLSFKIKEEIKSFPDKKKLKEFVNISYQTSKTSTATNVKGLALRRGRRRERKKKQKKIA